MNSTPLTLVPAPILKQKAKKVTDFGPTLRELADTMVETMRESRGMGLAAPQVGEPVRLIVLEYEPDERGEARIPLTILVNPTITDSGRQTDWMDEGCLSIPGVELPVQRPTQVNVLAEDLDGNRVKIRAKDLHARILQHEIDHINGVLMTDRAFPNLKELAGLRVVFMGTPEHAVPYLTALASTDMNIVGVVTETDKPAGRKQTLTAPPVKQQAELLKLPVYQPETLKGKAGQKLFAKLKPDLVIVVAYGKIIPADILTTVKHGFLNVHYSLLPEFRGATPHQSAILTGKYETGFSIFQLDAGMDTGPIVVQKKVRIEPQDTSHTLISKMVPLSISALLDVLPNYISGKRKAVPQNHDRATATQLFTKEDGRIDWQQPVEAIDRQIRAMQPWPAAYCEVANERVIIHAAHLDHGKLVLDIVQPAGRKPMHFRDYLRGNQNRLTFFSETGKVKLD
jgi:methionyl-tRNA formyltransferase